MNDLNTFLRTIPVAINCYLGDPFQDSQWEDTKMKLDMLYNDNHVGPIAIIHKGCLSEDQLIYLAKFDRQLLLVTSLTGLNELSISFDAQVESYIRASNVLSHVLCYVRPIIPGHNDSKENLSLIMDAVCSGSQHFALRGYKDVMIKGQPYKGVNKELYEWAAFESERRGITMHERSSCAAAHFFSRPCATHADEDPANIEFVRSVGYDLDVLNDDLVLNMNNRICSNGDLNFITMMCHRRPCFKGEIDNSTIMSLSFSGHVLNCTSSWFTWARQVECSLSCWYCMSRKDQNIFNYKNLGCLPSSLSGLKS